MTINTVIDSLPVARPDGMAVDRRQRFRRNVCDQLKWLNIAGSHRPLRPESPITLDRSFYRAHQDDFPIELEYQLLLSRHVPDRANLSSPVA